MVVAAVAMVVLEAMFFGFGYWKTSNLDGKTVYLLEIVLWFSKDIQDYIVNTIL